MGDDRAESRHTDPADESAYEPPTIHDFGQVREVTHGSADGSGDSNGQQV